jgi:ribonuclease BN (tRNA processing enzyme)
MCEEDSPKKHQWQTVSNKRKRINYQTSHEIAEQIQTTNRFECLNALPCDNNHPSTSKNSDNSKREPKPPPIYIYGVNNFKAMPGLPKMKPILLKRCLTIQYTPETYRKLIQHVRDEKIIHHTYQLKQERAYRIVIRDLYHSIPISDIAEELNKKGHKVRNMINVKHRVTKEPLLLFFVDLEPQSNNKEIYNLQLLLNCKIRVEPPNTKVPSYNVQDAKNMATQKILYKAI